MATTIMIFAYIGLIRGIAYFVAVPEDQAVEWHLGQLIAYRFMSVLPPVRQRMLRTVKHSVRASPSG